MLIQHNIFKKTLDSMYSLTSAQNHNLIILYQKLPTLNHLEILIKSKGLISEFTVINPNVYLKYSSKTNSLSIIYFASSISPIYL